MPLALFDLDNTLLAGDSDHAWGEFLVQRGLVDGAYYQRRNDEFFADYQRGQLDIHAFLEFALEPLARLPMADLRIHRATFLQQCIEPLRLPAADSLLARHRAAGDRLLIITATNLFITAPIAERLGVGEILATEPELINGRYTGHVHGTPCYREGKVKRLRQWLAAEGQSLAGSCFYSDSHNDLPLLEQVDRPVAVDPDPELRQIAKQRNWPIISLRD